mmetsp:Transcript_15450/g.19772  ORF Transcript_15450/g.19772 Transcript_15450/m.19772 type:complete len:84 (-) Transcript_15450:334-585(-)
MKAFLHCLKENNQNHLPCRELSKSYLKCRMDRNLMAKEEFDKLGFRDNDQAVKPSATPEGKKEEEGFTAGTTVRTRRKGWLWG